MRQVACPHHFAEIYTTPVVARDLTVDVGSNVEHASVAKCITTSAGELLKSVELVSVFALSEVQKSLSYRLIYQHKGTTLTADIVEQSLNKVRGVLASQLSATFRL